MSTEENLPEGWVWTTIGDAVEIRDDLRQPVNADERTQRSGPYPYYGATGQVGYIDSYLMDGEYVLLGEDGAPFLEPLKPKAYLISGKCWVNNHAHVLLFLEEMGNNRYLMHLLNTIGYHNAVSGTTRLKLTQSAMKQLLIPLAPLPEQARIVAAIEQQFTRLDSAVASLRSAKARAKQYRASLLKSAVEGELTKEWRTTHPVSETGAQLLQRILTERRKRWEEAEMAKMREKEITPKDDEWKQKYKEPQKPDVEHLPKLSEGWCWTTLDELSGHITSGSRGWAQYYIASGSLFVRVGNFNRLTTKIDLQNAVFVKAPNSIEADRCRLQIGDLLITITADVGMVGVVDESVLQWGEAYINQHVGLVRLLHSELTAFIALALASEVMQTQIRGKQYGATKTGLGLEDVKSLTVPLAPLSEQQYICAELERYLSIIQEQDLVIEASLKRAEHERQSILREAFAGRLVPQDPNDEPASVLLERIRVERKRRELAEQAVKANRKAEHMDGIRRRRADKSANGQLYVGLYEKLVEAGQPLPPDSLFKQVGLQSDEQPDSTRVFYRELQTDEQDESIEVTRPDDTLVLLEVLKPYEVQDASSDVGEAGEEGMSSSGDVEQLENAHTQELPTLWDTNF